MQKVRFSKISIKIVLFEEETSSYFSRLLSNKQKKFDKAIKIIKKSDKIEILKEAVNMLNATVKSAIFKEILDVKTGEELKNKLVSKEYSRETWTRMRMLPLYDK